MRIRVLVAIFAVQFVLLGAGQEANSENREAIAIRSAIKLYMSPDPARVKETFYGSANLYTEDGKGGLRIIPLEQFLSNLAKGVASGQARPTMTIDFIDYSGSAATAKVTEISDAARVTDYFSLVRDATGWKVVSKTFGNVLSKKLDAFATTLRKVKSLAI